MKVTRIAMLNEQGRMVDSLSAVHSTAQDLINMVKDAPNNAILKITFDNGDYVESAFLPNIDIAVQIRDMIANYHP